MPYYLSMALKNVFRDLRRSVTLGINYFFISLLLFVVFAITAGMRKNVTDSVIASTAGHITISGEYIVNGRTFQGVRDYPQIAALIREQFPDVRLYTRYALSSTVYYKNVSKRLSFTGIDLAADDGLRGQLQLSDGTWDQFARQPNAVIMPREIMQYFDLQPTDELLVATRSRFGAFNTGTIQVRAVSTTGNYFLRDLVLGHFDFMRRLDLADSVTATRMYLFFDDLRNVDARRDALMQTLSRAGFITVKPAGSSEALNAVSAASPRYTVQDASVNQRRLTLATADEVTGIVSQAVAAINAIGLFIAAIMLFIISISIFINMRMTINERLLEIGTLRAMGSERGDIVLQFILENVFLSLFFIAGGIVAGLVCTGLLSHVITLPPRGMVGLFLRDGHFVVQPTVGAAVFITAILVSFTALFSFFPARRGGRIAPVDALNTTT